MQLAQFALTAVCSISLYEVLTALLYEVVSPSFLAPLFPISVLSLFCIFTTCYAEYVNEHYELTS